MTEEEVTALIGGPGEDHPNERNNVWYVFCGPEPHFGSYSKEWINDKGSALVVNFDREGRVVGMLGGFVAPSETWFERILNACRAAFR